MATVKFTVASITVEGRTYLDIDELLVCMYQLREAGYTVSDGVFDLLGQMKEQKRGGNQR